MSTPETTTTTHDSAAQPTLRDQIEAALRTVFDPEIPVNIYDLGLVYDIRIGDKTRRQRNAPRDYQQRGN